MRCVCPACGATVSLEAFLTDAEARQFMAVLTRLPGPVVKLAPGYLALFRPTKTRVLQWRKGSRLLEDLEALMAKGFVHRQGQVDRPCPPSVWAQAIEKIVYAPPARLPLNNHHYLAAIAWDLADDADKRQEASRETAKKRNADLTTTTNRGGDLKRPTVPLSPEVMKKIRQESMKKRNSN